MSALPSLLISQDEISSVLQRAIDSRCSVQALFNQGKYVFLTSLISFDAENAYLNFDGTDEMAVMNVIDFYSPAVFVLFMDGMRYQFLSKNSFFEKTDYKNLLKIATPYSVTVVEGRKTARYDLPEGSAYLRASIGGSDVGFPIREISRGGLSMWSGSAHGLTPHSSVKGAEIRFSDGLSVPCSIEIVRISYTLGSDADKTHIIACKFIDVAEKKAAALNERISELAKANSSF